MVLLSTELMFEKWSNKRRGSKMRDFETNVSNKDVLHSRSRWKDTTSSKRIRT